MFDYIVVGCGYAGAVCARRIAEELNKKVLIIDKRNHIAGNMYDEYDKDGILIHRYGPHISVMNTDECFNFLSRFTEWIPYEHKVLAEIDGKKVPLPFNLTAVDVLFDAKKSFIIKDALVAEYGKEAKIAIFDMLKNNNDVIKELAEYVYEKVFLYYTMKMWGLRPEEIDPSITARVPIHISYDDRHFSHRIQVMPKDGFTKLFEKILNHSNITVNLGINSNDVIKLDMKKREVFFEGSKFDGGIIYTGALDELFKYEFGILPYRSLEFKFETYQLDYIQDSPVLNWPDDRPETRRTEMKRLTQQIKHVVTSTITEYPGTYNKDANKWNDRYYPVITERNNYIYSCYRNKLSEFDKFYIVGRLADYKYYNMEAVILRAFEVFEKEISKDV